MYKKNKNDFLGGGVFLICVKLKLYDKWKIILNKVIYKDNYILMLIYEFGEVKYWFLIVLI